MKFAIIAAIDKDKGIGRDGKLPWRLKGDMDYFKTITTRCDNPQCQNVIIMGRVTWDSLSEKFKPLPNRINVVLSRRRDFKLPDGVILATSLNEALDLLTGLGQGVERVFVIGGASVYAEAINHPACQKIYLTEIDNNYGCDVFFPPINSHLYIKRRQSDLQEENSIRYKFVEYEKN